MRILAFLLILGSSAALAQAATLSSESSMKMEMHGSAVTGSNAIQNPLSSGLDEFPSDIPTNRISKFANSTTPLDVTGAVRSAKGGQIYRAVSPAVVLVATKEGFGSGSLLDTAGNIITNWHVVKGYEYVAVIFKPTVEGKEPTRDDIKRGRVVKYDEIADLALVKVSEVSTGKTPIRLGDASEIAVSAWMFMQLATPPVRRGPTQRASSASIGGLMSGRRKAIRSSTKPTLFKPRPQSIPETPAGHYLATPATLSGSTASKRVARV